MSDGSRWRVWLVRLLVCAMIGACSTPPGPPPATQPPSTSAAAASPQPTIAVGSPKPTPALGATEAPNAGGMQIVFHSDPGGGSDLYLMNPDGSGLVRLTENFNTEAFSKISPDGRWLAFSNRGDGDLFLLDLAAAQQGDNPSPANLTRSSQSDAEPAWSPDSQKIAHGSYDTGHIYWLEINRAAGSVTATHDPQAPGFGPVWSPDGARLAFFSERDGNLEIYVMAADGSGQTRLTDDPAADYSPRWSPDGQHLLFISERDGNAEVYVMRVADALPGPGGSEPVNVSDDPAHDEFADWSPDSSRIVYVSYPDGADPFSIGEGNAEIFVVNPDGSGKTNLTNNDVWDGDPAWSPDGEWIVFTQRVGQQRQGHIHVMRPDGTENTRLVGEPGAWNDCCATWRPAGWRQSALAGGGVMGRVLAQPGPKPGIQGTQATDLDH